MIIDTIHIDKFKDQLKCPKCEIFLFHRDIIAHLYNDYDHHHNPELLFDIYRCPRCFSVIKKVI